MARNSLLSLSFIIITFYAAHAQYTSVTGVWQDSTGTASPFSDCIAIITEDNAGRLTFSHTLKFNEQLFIEQGNGQRKNNKLEYHVYVMHGIPGWSTEGDHTLTLSEDGNTLRGFYKDNLGNTGPLVYFRKE